jgi:integrase
MTVSGIKRAWNEVRAVSGLNGFTPYHTRHTALTRWAEGGMEIGKLMELSGHLTIRQMRHYARISDAVKRRALQDVMEREPKKFGPMAESSPFYTARVGGLRHFG